MFQSSQICCCQNFCSPARLHLPPHRLLYSLCTIQGQPGWLCTSGEHDLQYILIHSSILSSAPLDSSTLFPHCRMLLSGRVIRHENRNLFPKDNLLKWLFARMTIISSLSASVPH